MSVNKKNNFKGKALPVSANLDSYFDNPCPVLSANNVNFIEDLIKNQSFQWIVEYGLGASTFYFLHEAKKRQGVHYIAIENHFGWFLTCLRKLETDFAFKKTVLSVSPWSIAEIKDFCKAEPTVNLPEGKSRLSRWQEKMATGPFFRFSPHSNSRFRGALGNFWSIAKPLFSAFMQIIYCLFPSYRPHNSQWTGQLDDFHLTLINIAPAIKDQFGENPKNDYTQAGLTAIREALRSGIDQSALFIIDGGPRHCILQEIFKLEEMYPNFRPTIVLCDAWRKYYRDTLATRPNGRFIAGTNKTLKGEIVQNNLVEEDVFVAGKTISGDELAKKEIWFYSSESVAEKCEIV